MKSSIAEPVPVGDDIIVIEHLYKSFGSVQAVVDASLRVKRGEVCFIFGPSGGGKSTLLRCINGLEKPDSGTLIVDGIDEAVEAVGRVTSLSRRRCREAFEKRFTARRMALKYTTIYKKLTDIYKESKLA